MNRIGSLSLTLLLLSGAVSHADAQERERAHPGGAGAARCASSARLPVDLHLMVGDRCSINVTTMAAITPPLGAVRPSLPPDYRAYSRGNERFYFNGGIWYAPRGPGFVVVPAPLGLVVTVLPPYYSTVWFGGNPYYYADNVYYTWQPDQSGYAVVDPPENADQPSPPPDAPPPTGAQQDLIVYPKSGQSKDQQAADHTNAMAGLRIKRGSIQLNLPAEWLEAIWTERAATITARCQRVCRDVDTK